MGDKRANVRSAHLKRAHISRPFLSQTDSVNYGTVVIHSTESVPFTSAAAQLTMAHSEFLCWRAACLSRVKASSLIALLSGLLYHFQSFPLGASLMPSNPWWGDWNVHPPPTHTACRYQMIIWSAKREHSDVDFPESVGFLGCHRKERHKHCAGEMAKSVKRLSSQAQGSRLNPQSPHLKNKTGACCVQLNTSSCDSEEGFKCEESMAESSWDFKVKRHEASRWRFAAWMVNIIRVRHTRGSHRKGH